jgi:hypothetical protein
VRRDVAIGVRVFHNRGRMCYKGLGKTFESACGGDLGRGKVEELRSNSGQRVATTAATPNPLCGFQSDRPSILERPKLA